MSTPPSPGVPRREFVTGGLVACTLGLGCLPAVDGCLTRVASNEHPGLYQVSGPSMNPTLWGPSRSLDCPSCGVTIHVDELILQTAWERLIENSLSLSALVCWHCGSPIEHAELSAALQGPGVAPDVLEVSPAASTDYEFGDVLLIRKSDVQVKRLLGKPGQTISLDDAGRLLVDGQRPTLDSPPRVAVDFDRLRNSSRWHCTGASSKSDSTGASSRSDSTGESSRWQRGADRSWTSLGDTGWLAYAHQNVYRGPRPSRVLDDYPGNLGIEHALFPADGLSIQFELAASAVDKDDEIQCSIAFWTDQGIDLQQQIVKVGRKVPVKVDARVRAIRPNTPPRYPGRDTATMLAGLLSPKCPIAMQFFPSSAAAITLRDLAVFRDVLYRVNPRAPRGGVTNQPHPPSYPVHLGDDEWFVVGDNVPVSIDSRHWGALITQEITGRVGAIRGRVRFESVLPIASQSASFQRFDKI